MKKRILALVLALATLVGMLSGCAPKAPQQPEEQAVTRGEWISMIGQTLGMEEYQQEDAYYQDITPDSEAYPYVQSCREWGILPDSEDGQFHADEPATPEFIATTAALATGTVPEDILGDQEAILDFAQQQGLTPQGGKEVSGEAALAIAGSAQDIYMNDRHDQVTDLVWAEGVVDLKEIPQVTVQGDVVSMPAEQAGLLSEGSVFVTPPTASDPGGIARKVTGMSVVDGQAVFQTVEPDLGEVFDEVTIYDSAVPDPGAAILEPGVTMGGAVGNYTSGEFGPIVVDDLVNRPSNRAEAVATRGASFTYTINFTKGKGSFSAGNDQANLSVDALLPAFPVDKVIGASPQADLGKIFEQSNLIKTIPITRDGLVQIDEKGWENVLSVENKVKGGYEITGSISIKNLYVDTGFEFKKIFGIPTGIKRAVFEINGDFSTDLTVKGTLSEELSIATVPVSVGGVGTVELKLILYANASGKLQIKAELGSNTKFEYNDGNFKKTKKTNQSISSEVALELEAGPKLQVLFKVVGIKIIDANVSVGVNFTFGAKEKIAKTTTNTGGSETSKMATWTYSIVFESHVRLPIITLEVGGNPQTLANKIGIKYKWNLISKENAPVDWKPEFLNREIVIWTYSEGEEGEPEEEAGFDLESYVVVISGTPQTIVLNPLEGKKLPKIKWTSEDPGIATVDDTGTVHPVSTGVTVVTATSAEDPNQVVRCTVIVEEIGEENWEFLPADMTAA